MKIGIGDVLSITSGPFKGQKGKVTKIGGGKISLDVDMFGRNAPYEDADISVVADENSRVVVLLELKERFSKLHKHSNRIWWVRDLSENPNRDLMARFKAWKPVNHQILKQIDGFFDEFEKQFPENLEPAKFSEKWSNNAASWYQKSAYDEAEMESFPSDLVSKAIELFQEACQIKLKESGET